MIKGVHTMFYTSQPEATRAFLRDTLRFPFTDVGGGWLIFGAQIDGINMLPILLGVVFFLQQKLQPKPPALTPEQEQQQKMMQWMSLLFPLFLYKGPSGLNLYILTSTTIGIFENKIIRDHIKQREEAEKAGKVIVDASPARRGKSAPAVSRKPDGSENPGCLASVWANLQKLAQAGIRAVLIGESLMRSEDIESKVRELFG